MKAWINIFLKRIWVIFKTIILKILYSPVYKHRVKKPINRNKIVFVEVRADKLTDNFELLYKEFKAKGYEIKVHYIRNTFVGLWEYYKRCNSMLHDISDARFVFLNEASDVLGAIPLRHETKIIQVWHGCGAFKKFGFSTLGIKAITYNNTSLVSVSSPEVIWAYLEAMNLKETPDKVKALGVSRTDVYFDENFKENAYKKFYEYYPEAKNKKIILYAPTFRGNISAGYLNKNIDMKKMRGRLSKEYILLCKFHPLAREIDSFIDTSFAKDVTKTFDIDELISIADICISDYSSLIFEFSLMNKPMIFFPYDLEDYIDNRGFYYNYLDFVPGPIVKDTEELLEQISVIDENFDYERLKRFRDKFMISCDGNSTVRLIDYIENEL